MTITASIKISSHAGVYGDNHLKERVRTAVNIQKNNKRNDEVGFTFRLSSSFKFFMVFLLLLYFFILF